MFVVDEINKFIYREDDLLDEGEYRASSTFMPHPYCTASGAGKTYMIYK